MLHQGEDARPPALLNAFAAFPGSCDDHKSEVALTSITVLTAIIIIDTQAG